MNVAGSTRRIPRTRVWLARSLVALAAATALSAVTAPAAHAGVFVSVNIAPPVLPVYAQPAIPGPGYIWTPGYWAYDPVSGYYWVPGTWVMPPYTGALWTPGYWGWGDGAYVFHAGYWGMHVGYYGGINYGFGYVGVGYAGGYWGPHGFYYNREVNHITNVNITNVYNKTVVVN
ncbi:MAG: YXWGXW repeat-containing protein, partial [Rudaea sp.]|nr:YXWGXW repeat-containing protein [Rudaea sp.]